MPRDTTPAQLATMACILYAADIVGLAVRTQSMTGNLSVDQSREYMGEAYTLLLTAREFLDDEAKDHAP